MNKKQSKTKLMNTAIRSYKTFRADIDQHLNTEKIILEAEIKNAENSDLPHKVATLQEKSKKWRKAINALYDKIMKTCGKDSFEMQCRVNEYVKLVNEITRRHNDLVENMLVYALINVKWPEFTIKSGK